MAHGGGWLKSSRSVPSTQWLMPASQAKCTTGTPASRTAQDVTSEKAAFRLKPLKRVEALKKTTGR